MKKIILFSAMMATSTLFVSCGNHKAATTEAKVGQFECPMKCEPASDKAGKCSKCGMDLVEVKAK